MSAGSTVRALPTLLRVGFAEAVAYRAELLVWVLSTTMPFIMLALWSAVAREAPVGRFDQPQFVAYFLATFIVRQLTGSWISWQLNYEIRQGTLSQRLLRPIHPMVGFATEAVCVAPMRLVASAPVVVLALWAVGSRALPGTPALWAIWCAAMLGGWLITFLASFSIGCLAFFLGSSIRVMDAWLVLYYVFSGYLVPVELFPGPVRVAVDWLPFRYQIGFPVEVMTSAHDAASALVLLCRQWVFVLVLSGLAAVLWRAGIKRFGAFGG